ncbi:MAG: hypothetical protein ACOX4N_00240 [Dethiobacteraceae bacterium]|jgi:hypothetical protein
MKRLVVLLLILTVVITASPVYAAECIRLDEGSVYPDNDIQVWRNPDGQFQYMSYVVHDTGARHGIRYRVTDLTITVAGITGSIPHSSLNFTNPKPGQRAVTVVIIYEQDIIDALGVADDPIMLERVKAALNKKGSISTGAKMEIYNAKTGKVLAKLNSKEDAEKYGTRWGFPRDDINAMKSRFQDTVVESTDPPPYFPPIEKIDGEVKIETYNGISNSEKGRGAWEILPIFGKDAHRTVRAGGGFELEVTIEYEGKNPDDLLAVALFPYGKIGKQHGERVRLERIGKEEISPNKWRLTWRFPLRTYQGETKLHQAHNWPVDINFPDAYPDKFLSLVKKARKEVEPRIDFDDRYRFYIHISKTDAKEDEPVLEIEDYLYVFGCVYDDLYLKRVY